MKTVTFIKAAILFDLDGVLVDSKIPVERSWREWARRHSLDVEEVIRESHGRRTIEMVQMFTPQLDVEREAAELDSHEAGDLTGLREVRGAQELIASLPTERWAVATSGIGEVARTRLKALQFPLPHVLISADMVRKGKPDPEPYLRAAEGLGFKPADCLVIEDAASGIASARAAGMEVVGVTTTFAPSMLTGSTVIVPDLAAISVEIGQTLKVNVRVDAAASAV
jgi:mannitol-1-/sugar-/sorbitol-6-phosphatase